ncbi:MAG: hypothetical protein H6719_00900 [Sandaracinaceae bacterium]|nr:hypothetical protein [Sandaracinaceae bacterium]
MKELARFLLQNTQLDFSGEVSIDQIRQFLRDDDSREARTLLAKLIEDKGVDDMLVTVADCLKEHIPNGIDDDTIRAQLIFYSES